MIDAASDRVISGTLEQRSVQGRELVYAIAGAPQNVRSKGLAEVREKTSSHAASRRVFEQYLTQWVSLTQAAIDKDEILEQWHDSWVEAQRQGEEGRLEPNFTVEPGNEVLQQVPDMRVRHYFLRPEPGKLRELQSLVRRLQRMDVTVEVLTRSLRVPDYRPYGRAARSETLPAGTIWVPMAQRQKHWIQSMLNASAS